MFKILDILLVLAIVLWVYPQGTSSVVATDLGSLGGINFQEVKDAYEFFSQRLKTLDDQYKEMAEDIEKSTKKVTKKKTKQVAKKATKKVPKAKSYSK